MYLTVIYFFIYINIYMLENKGYNKIRVRTLMQIISLFPVFY